MTEFASAIALGIGSSVAAILGAYALVVKAKAVAGMPLAILRRLWDWIEAAGLADRVPPTLARDVRHALDRDTTDPTGDTDGSTP